MINYCIQLVLLSSKYVFAFRYVILISTMLYFRSQEQIADDIGNHPLTSIENTGFRRTSDFLRHSVFNRYVAGHSSYCKTLIIRVTLFREVISQDLFTRLYFAIRHIFFYNPYNRNYWRGIYFRVSMLSRIYAIKKSSRIKSVLQ